MSIILEILKEKMCIKRYRHQIPEHTNYISFPLRLNQKGSPQYSQTLITPLAARTESCAECLKTSQSASILPTALSTTQTNPAPPPITFSLGSQI